MEKKIRPPIVTVLGHVDHGKTTLLDKIRKTSVAAKEAGGITQGIGASEVTTKEGKRITFIDTPGHAAFSKMRSRGAKVCDIAILVVDASDGVKPQTKEALTLIKEAKIPYLVAITKIDLPAANPEGVLSQLTKEGVAFEGRGGEVPFVEVSAKEGKGIDKLLELITLLAEVSGVAGKKEAPLEAVVIETTKDRRGQLVSAVVREGSLKVGEEIFADGQKAKVRGLFDFGGRPVKEIFPGEPVAILGFSQLPAVGARVTSEVKPITPVAIPLKETSYKKLGPDELSVLLKAENSGALEALTSSLPPKVVVVEGSVGEVLESDVLLAKATKAVIFAFVSQVGSSVRKLAEAEGVKIEKYDIIYELLDRVDELLKKGQEEVLGKAEVIAEFPFEGKRIAGCKVLSGKINIKEKIIILRDEKKIGQVKIVSMKKGKQAITLASSGEEFGVLIEPQLDFAKGDVLVSVANGK